MIASRAAGATTAQGPNATGSILYARQTLPDQPDGPVRWDLVLTRFPNGESRSIFPGEQADVNPGRIAAARFLADRRHVVVLLHRHQAPIKDPARESVEAVCLLDTLTGKWSYVARNLAASETHGLFRLSPDRNTLVFAGPTAGSLYVWTINHMPRMMHQPKGWHYASCGYMECLGSDCVHVAWPGRSANPRVMQRNDRTGGMRFVWVDAVTGQPKLAKWPDFKMTSGLAHGRRVREEKKRLILLDKRGNHTLLASTEFESRRVESSPDGRYIVWSTKYRYQIPEYRLWTADSYYTFFDLGGVTPQRIMPKSKLLSNVNPPGIIAWGLKPDAFYAAYVRFSNVEEGPDSAAFDDYDRSVYRAKLPELDTTLIGSIPRGDDFMDLLEDIPTPSE